MEPVLITGLGNPGKEYQNTRHNIGFMVVDFLAKMMASTFVKKNRLEGMITIVKGFRETEWVLLKPLSYMNRSGSPVHQTLRFFDIPTQALLVVVDDMDLPFGTIRSRLSGSNGGHNGLKSIENHIQTRDFARIRMGIANAELDFLRKNKNKDSISRFVLSPFNNEEEKMMPVFLELAGNEIFRFIKEKTARSISLNDQEPN